MHRQGTRDRRPLLLAAGQLGRYFIRLVTDTDPFQGVREWWNTGENAFAAPSDHLFGLLGLPAGVAAGQYPVGRGSLTVLRQDPSDFVLSAGAEKPLLEAVERFIGLLETGNALLLDRGPYRIVAVLDESPETAPYVAEGCLIDLYDPALPVYTRREVPPGSQALFYDVTRAGKAPCILAAASRAYDEKRSRRGFSYLCKGPADTYNVTRILLPSAPSAITVAGQPVGASTGADDAAGTFACWDPASRTLFLRFPNSPDGVPVSIGW